jgi:predicted RNA-binding protein
MCEANAYMTKNGEETLLMKSVDLVEPEPDGTYHLVGIFGDQLTVKGKLKRMNLVDHRILFEE